MSEPIFTAPQYELEPRSASMVLTAAVVSQTASRIQAQLKAVEHLESAVHALEQANEYQQDAEQTWGFLRSDFPEYVNECLTVFRDATRVNEIAFDSVSAPADLMAEIIVSGLIGGHDAAGRRLAKVPYEDVLKDVRERVWDLIGYKHDRKRKHFSANESLEIFSRDDYKCVECNTQRDLTVDHIIPWSKGGSDEPFNLQTLCKSCNSRKGNRA